MALPAAAPARSADRCGRPVRTNTKRRVAAAIRDYLARERVSREQFAFKTKLGKSTIDKLLTGLFSERTLAIVEGYTKLPLRELLEGPPDHALLDAQASATSVDQPWISIMPFTKTSSDPDDEHLEDGIEEVIAALAPLRRPFLIAWGRDAPKSMRTICCEWQEQRRPARLPVIRRAER
jgi:hypothetical protein